MKFFGKKFGKTKVFGHISKRGIPYVGVKYKDKKGDSKSFTMSPIKKNLYTKDKIGKDHILRTKTNLDSFSPKIKISKIKKRHY
jgi:hypothetical protein